MSPTGCDHGSSEGKHGKLRQQNGVYLEDGPPVSRGLVTPKTSQNYKPCSWPFGRDPITPDLGDSLTDGEPILQSSSQQPITLGGWTAWERRSGPAGKCTGKEGNPLQDSGEFFFSDLVV